MADYTPTSDVFARFVEGLKFGANARTSQTEDALKSLQLQKLQDDMARAKRTESLDLMYASGGNIESGEDLDKALRMAVAGGPRAANPQQLLNGFEPLPTGELDIRKAPTKPTVNIPMDPGATGISGYGVPEARTKEFMEAQPDLLRYEEGLAQLSKPTGLGIQTDASGQLFIPGRKRTDKPTLLPPPANAQIVTLPGSDQQFYTYNTSRGQQFGQVTPSNFAVNEFTGQVVQLPRGAELYTPPGAAASQETATRLNSLEKGVRVLENLLTKAPAGRIKGNFAAIANALGGWYPEVRGAKDIGGLLAPMTTRLIGGDVGNLSIVEQQASKRLTETLVSATPEERKQALGIIKTLIAYRRAANDKKLTGGALWNNTTGALNELNMPSYNTLMAAVADPSVPLGQAAQVVKAKSTEATVLPSTGTVQGTKPANKAW